MRLLFVYNANSGTLNSWLDIAHKSLAPNSYTCSLCQLTHGPFLERKKWKHFRESLKTNRPEVQLEFLHKDTFLEKYASKWLPKYDFPIVLLGRDADFEILLNTTQLNKMKSVPELIQTLQSKLKET